MVEDNKPKKVGCLKLLLAGIGFLILLSPLNPFIEWKDVGDDKMLTNSSWLVVTVMLFAYGYFALKWLSSGKD